MRTALDRCRETLRLVRADATNDAMGLDGLPLNGLAIGTQFGNTLAMIDALAGVVDELVSVLDRELS